MHAGTRPHKDPAVSAAPPRCDRYLSYRAVLTLGPSTNSINPVNCLRRGVPEYIYNGTRMNGPGNASSDSEVSDQGTDRKYSVAELQLIELQHEKELRHVVPGLSGLSQSTYT
jgi:hypothetical protein